MSNEPDSEKKPPSPGGYHRYEFAAKKTYGLFSSAAKKLAIIIITAIVLALALIFLFST